MERNSTSVRFPIGSQLPEFALRNVDGSQIGTRFLSSGKLALVVFTCNHCPYVKGSESALIAVVKEFEPSGLKAVTINSNDATEYPDDSWEKMKEKSKSMNLPYPYLHDESQDVAKQFDAACTPECYLFNSQGSLIFHGTINDNPKDSSLSKNDLLKRAISQALAGQTPNPDFVHPIGCSIKWKIKS